MLGTEPALPKYDLNNAEMAQCIARLFVQCQMAIKHHVGQPKLPDIDEVMSAMIDDTCAVTLRSFHAWLSQEKQRKVRLLPASLQEDDEQSLSQTTQERDKCKSQANEAQTGGGEGKVEDDQ